MGGGKYCQALRAAPAGGEIQRQCAWITMCNECMRFPRVQKALIGNGLLILDF